MQVNLICEITSVTREYMLNTNNELVFNRGKDVPLTCIRKSFVNIEKGESERRQVNNGDTRKFYSCF